jgi:hypothetical protein
MKKALLAHLEDTRSDTSLAEIACLTPGFFIELGEILNPESAAWPSGSCCIAWANREKTWGES